MQEDEQLTAAECEQLSVLLTEDAAALPAGEKHETLLKLAESYRALAIMKRTILRTVN